MIDPALTPEDWAKGSFHRDHPDPLTNYYEARPTVWLRKGGLCITFPSIGGGPPDCAKHPDDLRAATAFANDALPDGDERKITWEHVDAIRHELDEEWSGSSGDAFPHVARLRELADLLESYLPPRSP